MNDPTNWNIDPAIKSLEVDSPELAKEMERRWNGYPLLMEALETALDSGTFPSSLEGWAAAWRDTIQKQKK